MKRSVPHRTAPNQSATAYRPQSAHLSGVQETGATAQRHLSTMPFAPVHLGNRGQQSKRQICSNSTTRARGGAQETDHPKHSKATHMRQEDNPSHTADGQEGRTARTHKDDNTVRVPALNPVTGTVQATRHHRAKTGQLPPLSTGRPQWTVARGVFWGTLVSAWIPSKAWCCWTYSCVSLGLWALADPKWCVNGQGKIHTQQALA